MFLGYINTETLNIWYTDSKIVHLRLQSCQVKWNTRFLRGQNFKVVLYQQYFNDFFVFEIVRIYIGPNVNAKSFKRQKIIDILSLSKNFKFLTPSKPGILLLWATL